ncbi:hypothetical protein Ga0123461_1577 [Mariprofundus aestuarium]|uniref:Uncharacterized protein n=1 Tax=Mariprofundus aestuarium TaxID=1921086 RepID=A0A2K8KYB1_MARES|nr:hypothetical protein [Mariprofundus aestuarium]ATX79990.1 hypothetical protein Ga0123461_1577 [Mariprofundus aestuarium]
MARPNFKYEKRQKEIAKQKKNEEKRLRKLEKRSDTPEGEVPEVETTESVADDVVNDESPDPSASRFW